MNVEGEREPLARILISSTAHQPLAKSRSFAHFISRPAKRGAAHLRAGRRRLRQIGKLYSLTLLPPTFTFPRFSPRPTSGTTRLSRERVSTVARSSTLRVRVSGVSREKEKERESVVRDNVKSCQKFNNASIVRTYHSVHPL